MGLEREMEGAVCVEWGTLWAWNGVLVVGAPPPLEAEATEASRYIYGHMGVWRHMEERYGLKKGMADSERAAGEGALSMRF